MQSKSQGFGVAGFVLGMVSVVFVFISFITLPYNLGPKLLGVSFVSVTQFVTALSAGILAIVFYNKQKKICRNGLSTAGLVLGTVGLSVAMFILLLLASLPYL